MVAGGGDRHRRSPFNFSGGQGGCYLSVHGVDDIAVSSRVQSRSSLYLYALDCSAYDMRSMIW